MVPGHEDSTFGNIFASHVKHGDFPASIAECGTEHDLFFISVANPAWTDLQPDMDGGLTKDFKYGRDAGDPGREDTVTVPMRLDRLPASAANLVYTRLPAVATSLGEIGH